MGVENAFRQTCRSGREEDFGDGLRADCCKGFFHLQGRGSLQQARKRSRGFAFDFSPVDHDFNPREIKGVHSPVEHGAVFDIDQRRPHFLEYGLELAEVLAQERIGHGNRRYRHSCNKTSQHEQSMADGVAGEDHYRPIGSQSPVEQCLGDRVGQARCLAVRHQLPFPIRASLPEKGAVRCLPGPAAQQDPEVFLIGFERHGGTDEVASLRRGHDIDFGRRQFNRYVSLAIAPDHPDLPFPLLRWSLDGCDPSLTHRFLL